MKAIVQEKYGEPEEVLQLREVPVPAVKDDEVLIRVRAASVHPDVWHVVAGRPYIIRLLGVGLRGPKHPIPGTDVAGTVETVGKDVTQFKSGDEVFGESHRGLQWSNGGAFAEYVAAPQTALVHKPNGVTFEQAAAIPTSGLIALPSLRLGGDIRPGQKILINGAAGGVGSIALQIAKAYGAEVTGVDSTERLDIIRALGADHVIDYTQVDFTRGSVRYDLIFDVASNLTLDDCKHVLTPIGKYIRIGHDHYGQVGSRMFGGLPGFFAHELRSVFDRHLPNLNFKVPRKDEIMPVLKAFLEDGRLTPVIDRSFSLNDVPQAMRYLQAGRARGKIVVTP